MISSRIAIVASLAGGLMLPVAGLHAQSSLGNKSVPGVCMLSRGAVLSNAKVGKAADARLKQLAEQARTQLENQRKPLDQSIQQFQQNAKSMSDSQRESQQKSLQQRMQSFQKQAQELDARIRLTRNQATQRIAQTLDPLVADIYKRHSCGILLDRDTVLGGNPQNDLTAEAVKALDGKMSTISFNLAPLPKQSGNNGNGQ